MDRLSNFIHDDLIFYDEYKGYFLDVYFLRFTANMMFDEMFGSFGIYASYLDKTSTRISTIETTPRYVNFSGFVDT